jgi:DDE_Tnp_1-associated
MTLIDYLAELPDKRRGAGQRHDQTLILTITIMSIMSNYIGYRAIGDFVKRNREELLKHLQPAKNRLPSFYTIRRVLQNMDYDELSEAIYKWAKQRVSIRKNEWLQIDGKAIGGTITNACNSEQSFVSLVSIYASRHRQVIASKAFKQKKANELQTVQQLISELDISEVNFSLDALHCQKKRQPLLRKRNAIIS